MNRTYGQRRLAIAVLIGLIAAVQNPAATLAYSCGSRLGNHCYNTITWPGALPGSLTNGIYTVVQSNPGGMHAGSTLEDQISNEIWLVDTSCANWCWLEAGYLAGSNYDNSATSPKFFISQQRPDGTTPTDYYDIYATGASQATSIRIYSDFCDWNTWDIAAYNRFTTMLVMRSITLPMHPNFNEIGTELGGSSGSASDQFTWANNYWADCNGPSTSFWAQTSSGGLSPDDPLHTRCVLGFCIYSPRNPPSGNWAQVPSPSNLGGLFYSYCC